ncbi:hypothetical protein K440DRAFT_632941 [Wilcoxina mikolae CBS 423.85]|nr:hypothetical protein K440DRAFT_632941 [Wilcoxina mikolae CBS 423.85]
MECRLACLRLYQKTHSNTIDIPNTTPETPDNSRTSSSVPGGDPEGLCPSTATHLPSANAIAPDPSAVSDEAIQVLRTVPHNPIVDLPPRYFTPPPVLAAEPANFTIFPELDLSVEVEDRRTLSTPIQLRITGKADLGVAYGD